MTKEEFLDYLMEGIYGGLKDIDKPALRNELESKLNSVLNQQTENIKKQQLNKFCDWLTGTWCKQIHIPFGYEYTIERYIAFLKPNNTDHTQQQKCDETKCCCQNPVPNGGFSSCCTIHNENPIPCPVNNELTLEEMHFEQPEEKPQPENKEKRKALSAITAWRQLKGLNLLNKEESASIQDKLMSLYGNYLSPLRTEQPHVWMCNVDESCGEATNQPKEKELCGGCNVRGNWEHRCFGNNCDCESPICMNKQGKITHKELMDIIN